MYGTSSVAGVSLGLVMLRTTAGLHVECGVTFTDVVDIAVCRDTDTYGYVGVAKDPLTPMTGDADRARRRSA